MALGAVTTVFGLLTLFTLWPYWVGMYGINYIWIVVFGVDIPVLVFLAVLWRSQHPNTIRRISALLKVDMLVGLSAIILGTG
jgi:hypothetical protein